MLGAMRGVSERTAGAARNRRFDRELCMAGLVQKKRALLPRQGFNVGLRYMVALHRSIRLRPFWYRPSV